MDKILRTANRAKSTIKNNWGFFALSATIIFIFIANVKPNSYLAGWDNFSASLNTELNLSRTVFSTWREYRGMGVPSDSEVTDAFRQLIFLVLSIFFKTTLIEQLYTYICLFIGTIAVYGLYKRLATHIGKNSIIELGGFVAGFFYLFNMNKL